MDPVVLTNSIDAVITSKVSSTDGEMIHFDISAKLEDEVELWTVNQDEIMEAGVNWRYDPN